MKLNPMETAPKDGTPVLVWGVWHWWKEDVPHSSPVSVRVCQYHQCYVWGDDDIGGFRTITSNPYDDELALGLGWLPLPYEGPLTLGEWER